MMPMASGLKYKKSADPFQERSREKADVEDAIIKIGQSEGEFSELGNCSEITRDPNYPIRVTLQFYKATSNGICDDSHLSAISSQIKESRKFGTAIGSLVIGGDTGRVTEHTGHYIRPPWWEEFWLMYKDVYPQYTKESAAAVVFKNGRFCSSSMDQCRQQVLDVLGNEGAGVPGQPPKWNVF